ncbi:MAG: PAS domain-containing sensor histidine kinase [Chloroflexi bacterium]|nr:PAS domain-containing sensor histidine kinase [Chloroflexota bacterium]
MQKFLRRLIPWKLTWRRTLLESGLFLAAYITWLILRSPDSSSRALIGSLAVLVPVANAAVLTLWAQPFFEKASKRSWIFLGLALLCWVLGGFIRTYYLVLRNITLPTFSLADGFNFLAYPFMFLALILYPPGNRYLPSRFRFILDAAISSGVIAALGWLVIARPAAQTSADSLLNLLPLAYPVADLVLLMILFNTLLANPRARRTSILWGLSLLAFLVSDYVYSYQVLIQDYQAGGPESLGWTLGSLLFGMSIIIEATANPKKNVKESPPDTGARLQNILPIVLVIVLIWFVLADWRLRGQPSTFGLWMALVMGLGLIVRLGVRAGEAELYKYWQLFSGLAEPTFICNARGNILLANPALVRALGRKNDAQVVNSHLFSLFDKKTFPANLLERAAHSASSLEVYLHASQTPYLLSLSPILTGDRKVLIAGVAYDISEQKSQQEALQKAYTDLKAVSRRLEELNTQLEEKVTERTQTLSEAYRQLEEQNKMLQTFDQLKSDFVSMVSHELRTPLTSLNGGLELLLARPGRRPEDKEAMRLMKNEVQRLTHFVENVLNLSVMEAGRLEARVEPVDLNLAVQDVLRAMSALPGVERVRVKVPAGLPGVLADESFIHSILTQLLDNALKYAPSGPVVVDALRLGGWLRVRVTDKGPGIPSEKRRLLFRRFQRLDAGDSQSVYGYGLGLYLSKQLLRSLKSDLHYETPLAGGARFYFDLQSTT